MQDKTYILALRTPGAEVNAEVERVLSQSHIRARITHRLPWGVVVRSDPSLVRVIKRKFPKLEIIEESFADLAGS